MTTSDGTTAAGIPEVGITAVPGHSDTRLDRLAIMVHDLVHEMRSGLRDIEVRQDGLAAAVASLREQISGAFQDSETRQHGQASMLIETRGAIADQQSRHEALEVRILNVVAEMRSQFQDVEIRQLDTRRALGEIANPAIEVREALEILISNVVAEMRSQFQDIEIRQLDTRRALGEIPNPAIEVREALVEELNRLDGYAHYHRERLRADIARVEAAAADGARPPLVLSVNGGRQFGLFGEYLIFLPADQFGLLAFLVAHPLSTIESGVQRAIREHVTPGGTAIDVGANFGLHSLLMATVVGAGGKVVSVEPNVAMAEDYRPRLDDGGRGRRD